MQQERKKKNQFLVRRRRKKEKETEISLSLSRRKISAKRAIRRSIAAHLPTTTRRGVFSFRIAAAAAAWPDLTTAVASSSLF